MQLKFKQICKLTLSFLFAFAIRLLICSSAPANAIVNIAADIVAVIILLSINGNLFVRNRKFDFRIFFRCFSVFFISLCITSFIRFLLHRDDFEFTFVTEGLIIDWSVYLVLAFSTAITEELLFRALPLSYPPETAKAKVFYALGSALLFTIFHLSNPEVEKNPLITLSFYFIMGFSLMLFCIETKGCELCIAIHSANNLVASWILGYDNSVLTTKPLFIQHNSINAELLIQTVFCILICLPLIRTLNKRH